MITPRANLMIENQLEAADKLLEILPLKELKEEDYIMICSSLDSVILVDEIARKLKMGYELLFSESIYAPNNGECAIASVSETEEIVMIDELVNSFEISLDYVYGQAHRKYEEKILKNVYKYRKGNLLQNLEGKKVIFIDEGCESGLTALSCIKTLLSLNAKSIIYVTPLIATDVYKGLEILVDEIYTVYNIENFVDVNFYYKDKIEARPEIIIQILEDSPYYLPLQKQGEKNAILNQHKQ